MMIELDRKIVIDLDKVDLIDHPPIWWEGYGVGSANGYNAGYTEGNWNGYIDGFEDGYDKGYEDGKNGRYNEVPVD